MLISFEEFCCFLVPIMQTHKCNRRIKRQLNVKKRDIRKKYVNPTSDTN